MKAAQIKLPFGINESNILVHIADVENGKKCCCVCPSCRSPLIAAKGSKRQHHFKHTVGDECEGGLESAIHLAAKKIITEKKQITLPEYVSIVSETDSRGIRQTEQETVVRDGMVIHFDSLQEEKELYGMKADILAISNNKPLVIEVFFRHKVEDYKLHKIVEANISAIEIKLSDLTPENVKDWDTFWSCINDPKRIQWLHNAKAHDSVYPKLKNQLAVKIQSLEKQYEQEIVRKKRQEQKEKAEFKQAQNEIRILSGKEHIALLKQKAETHPIWKYHSQYLSFSWHELPNFLNLDVPNGDWIFGCDRRVWQTAFYISFICHHGAPFSVNLANDWLQKEVGCKVPRCAKIVGVYGKRYPELVPAHVPGTLPSPWRTLSVYFNHLCQLGILEFSPNERGYTRDPWFRVISKTPGVAQCT